MYKKKSQSSLEFLMIFGIGFTIILILSGIFFGYFSAEKKTLDVKHLQNIGNEIIQNVEKIYFLGNGNRITINTNFPEGIENISIHHMNDIPLGAGVISFDYLNITYVSKNAIESVFFETNENYIRFTCKDCKNLVDGGNNVSYFNDSSLISPGSKKIRIESKGDIVEISFIR